MAFCINCNNFDIQVDLGIQEVRKPSYVGFAGYTETSLVFCIHEMYELI